jgi:hypothetical protein
MRVRTLGCLLLASLGAAGAVACDDSPPPPNPFAPPPGATKEAPPITSAPKIEGPPPLSIAPEGPKVGFDLVLIDKPDGLDRLRKALAPHKQYFTDQEVVLSIDRAVKLPWVITMVHELDALGAKKLVVRTGTRPEYSAELKFTPQSRVKNPEPCTLVMAVLDDRGTAVWHVSGGTAAKRHRGFAGPDLTTTAETLERLIKTCKSSTTMFLSAQSSIEWGLAYDLAASAQKVEGAQFDTIVLLEQEPVPGRPLKL